MGEKPPINERVRQLQAKGLPREEMMRILLEEGFRFEVFMPDLV
jgi:hypothetical protein